METIETIEPIREYAAAHREELLALFRQLCRIPAPSRSENARAAFCRAWLEKNGGRGVYVDGAANAVCPIGVTDRNDVVLLMAHTDTVFPAGTPLQPEIRDGRLYCPGAGDDTANLAILLMAAKYFLRSGAVPKCGVLFVADAGEEGLGNLRGCRALMETYGARVREAISFDLGPQTLVTRAVGSARYRITVTAPGGHSYGDFGSRSAIHAAAQLICALCEQPIPRDGGSKTTCNVGTVSGGTSVNTIAERAEFLYEYRSDSAACMEIMRGQLAGILAGFDRRGAEVCVEQIGLRPGMGACRDEARQQALIRRAETVLETVMGVRPKMTAGSTDCNIPFSMGIPSVSFGLAEGDGAHTRGESVALDSLPRGLEAALRFLAPYFTMPKQTGLSDKERMECSIH